MKTNKVSISKTFDGFFSRIPIRTRLALVNYVVEGHEPADFLLNVLGNDLRGAVEHADEENAAALPPIVRWLYNNAPSVCWGSSERVDAWVLHQGLSGLP